MKKFPCQFRILLLLLVVFQSCAKRGTPDGGPEDFTPPKYIRATPENFTTNFNSREIRIYFDEFIKLNEAQRQIIISPPMDPRPEITPMGTASKSIRIRITDTLQENTTYTINFGQSIVDNNAGNPLPFFQYIFSTGSYIDSLSVAGSISDAFFREAPTFVSVMLYEVDSTYTDSTVYQKQPRYITNTLDSLTTFELNYLKEGTYQLVALTDLNNNYRFDPNRETIGFLGHPISIPTDSVYDLRLFREIPEFALTRPKQVAGQHVIFGYTGIVAPDSLQIRMYPTPGDFEHRITKDIETDTLHYWFRPALERDSLTFVAQAPGYSDSLLTRHSKMEIDSLQLRIEPAGTVNFKESIRIIPNTPLDQLTESLLTLTDQDTLAVPFTLEYDDFRNTVYLDFQRKENQRYNLLALPGTFVDFFGDTNDTIRSSFRTQNLSDFGNVVVNLQNIKSFPIIVQLTDKDGKVVKEQFSGSESSFSFSLVKPGTYYIRVIYDVNNNQKWDTGNYLQRLQPEEVYYFLDPLDVRANWDVTQQIDLGYQPLPTDYFPDADLPLEPEGF